MPSASFSASRSCARRSRRKAAPRIPTPSRSNSGKNLKFDSFVMVAGRFYMDIEIAQYVFVWLINCYLLACMYKMNLVKFAHGVCCISLKIWSNPKPLSLLVLILGY